MSLIRGRVRVFETRVLRKIFWVHLIGRGVTGGWILKIIVSTVLVFMYDFQFSPDIRAIRSRMTRVGHVECMGGKRNA